MSGSRPLPPALRILAEERNHAADEAIAAALPHLDPEVQAAALAVLVRRNHEPTLYQLVSGHRKLGDKFRAELVRYVGDLHSVLRAAVSSEVAEECDSALQLIVEAKDAGLAYLLADAVRSTRRGTRELASTGLRELTGDVVAAPTPGAALPSQVGIQARRDALVEALQTVVSRFEPSAAFTPLEAALWLGDRVEPTLLKKLHEPRSKLAGAVNDILAIASDPKLAGAVLRALSTPELRASATRALTHCKKPEFIRALIAESWLLADAEIRQGLHRIPAGDWLETWVGLIPTLDEAESGRTIRLLGGVGGQSEQKWQRLRPLLDDPRASVKREVFWQLADDPEDASTHLLQMLASSRGDPSSHLATRECRRRQRRIAGPDSERVLAPALPEPGDLFAEFFAEFDRGAAPDHQGWADRIKASGIDIRRRLGSKLSALDAVDRCRAIRAARALGVLGEVAEQIFALASDPERIVRAAVMNALADLPGATSSRILRGALHDSDERVQANAVESLDQLDAADREAVLRPKLSSPNNRVRANAVRALLRLEVREAGNALLDMLEDPSSAHRGSALWVIERMHLRTVMQRVSEMSEKDADPRVRDRARRVLAQSTRPLRHRGNPRGPERPLTAPGGRP